MKISKLFHWLYATLMFLPVFALGSAILVNTFNNQAKDEVNIVYKYETNELNSLDDFVQGNVYHFKNANHGNLEGSLIGYIVNWDYFYFSQTIMEDIDEAVYINTTIDNSLNYSFYLSYESDNTIITFYNPNADSYIATYIDFRDNNSLLEFDFIFDSYFNFTSENWDDYLHLIITSSTYNEIERVEQKNITNVFYEAVDQIKNNDLFNWSSNTFFADAFVYIGSLFNIPSGSFIYLLLSYWFSISIIWMVFDMAIYVPLLIHRWLDKGVLK